MTTGAQGAGGWRERARNGSPPALRAVGRLLTYRVSWFSGCKHFHHSQRSYQPHASEKEAGKAGAASWLPKTHA